MDLSSLLTFPTTDAFSALPGSGETSWSTQSLSRTPNVIHFRGEPLKPIPQTVQDEDLNLLKRTIRTILTEEHPEPLATSNERIYTACRIVVCVSGRGQGLFDTLRIELEQYVARLARSLSSQKEQDPSKWIMHVVRDSSYFTSRISLITSLLTYLDQSFIRKNPKLPKIRELSYSLFSAQFFQNPVVAERLRSGVRDWVTWERQNRSEHRIRSHIPDLVSHLIAHGQYESLFESFYIDITRSFYAEESAELSGSINVDAGEFISHVVSRVKEEKQRATALLPPQSWSIIEGVTERALLDCRLHDLASKALSLYMGAKRMQDLTTLYRMYSRVGGIPILCAAFKDYVKTSVQSIVQDESLDDEMVQRLLDFKTVADATLITAFTDNASEKESSTYPTHFYYALIDAFQTGFRARRNKPAEMIAKYMDSALREPTIDASDKEFEKRVDAALALYRFTDDKDVFRTFYHRALAKRLLLGRTVTDDAEKHVLKKLEEQYDPEFGMGDHMFNDLALSRELLREYRDKITMESSPHQLSVMVLQQSVWPFAVRKTSCDLPPYMQAELTQYAAFYKTKHQGRKLDWDYALGTAILYAQFNSGSKELSVSLYQAVILLLFNDTTTDRLAFADIAAQTNMGDAELRRTLQSLACGKKRVLRKVPAGRDVGDHDVFHFNAEFTDSRARVHINSIQVKGTPEESQRTQMAVEGDRKFYLDAAIVRIMKARKELSYEQLKISLIEALKGHFVPEVNTIKQRIQVLVEQEYLKRDEEDMSKYVYVA